MQLSGPLMHTHMHLAQSHLASCKLAHSSVAQPWCQGLHVSRVPNDHPSIPSSPGPSSSPRTSLCEPRNTLQLWGLPASPYPGSPRGGSSGPERSSTPSPFLGYLRTIFFDDGIQALPCKQDDDGCLESGLEQGLCPNRFTYRASHQHSTF